MNRANIILIVFVVVLMATAFIWYRYSQTALRPAEDRVDTEIELGELRRLKGLELDTTILQDNFFRTLEEIPAQVTPQFPPPPKDIKPGRPNPFLPF